MSTASWKSRLILKTKKKSKRKVIILLVITIKKIQVRVDNFTGNNDKENKEVDNCIGENDKEYKLSQIGMITSQVKMMIKSRMALLNMITYER